jgi:LysR family transcriptional regulator, glycine cleavage system transcriptional activator
VEHKNTTTRAGVLRALEEEGPLAKLGGRQRRLPPLNLFRAFDAASRHLSFTLAAEELLVTQSAVSQQIRQLEDFLDVRLFRRLPRGLELTPEGTVLAGAVSDALNMIARACGKLADPEAPVILSINAEPAFASKWLAPRLKEFMERHETIRVTLLSSSDPVNFNRQDIDIAIRWGNGNWDGVDAQLIADSRVLAVCSPDLVPASAANLSLAALRRHTLLQVIHQPYWAIWVEHTGNKEVNFVNTLYFGDASLMIDAAIAAQGICFAPHTLLAAEIARGRLIEIPGTEITVAEGFYLLCSPETRDKPKISAFREWLQTKAIQSAQDRETIQ